MIGYKDGEIKAALKEKVGIQNVYQIEERQNKERKIKRKKEIEETSEQETRREKKGRKGKIKKTILCGCEEVHKQEEGQENLGCRRYKIGRMRGLFYRLTKKSKGGYKYYRGNTWREY